MPAMASFTTSGRSQPGITSGSEFDLSQLTQGESSKPDVMVEIAAASGATGRGVLIGLLSALGSAGVAIVVLTIIVFFKYTQRGRILLDRIGRPGEFDDEEAFAREEAEALETMDDLSRTEYLRAKGVFIPRHSLISKTGKMKKRPISNFFFSCAFYSLCPGESARNHADRYLAIAIPGYTRKGCLCMGI